MTACLVLDGAGEEPVVSLWDPRFSSPETPELRAAAAVLSRHEASFLFCESFILVHQNTLLSFILELTNMYCVPTTYHVPVSSRGAED